MKHLFILLASLALFACNSGDSAGAAKAAATTVEEPTETVGAEIADTMQDAMQKAADVGNTMEDHKDALDAAVEEAEESKSE